MNIEVLYRPSYSLAVVRLDPNERIRVDSGAMVSMQNVTIETKMEGGFLKSLGRSMLGGESFFQNWFQAGPQGGEVTLAPDLPGDVVSYEMNDETLLVQSGSYLASEAAIELETRLSGKSFMAGEGLTMLELKGRGKLLISSYGAIYEKYLQPGEKYTVDTTHLVAFNASMRIEARTVGGLKSTLLSGEGFVVDVTGPGKLLMQTRSPKALINWIIPQVPKKES